MNTGVEFRFYVNDEYFNLQTIDANVLREVVGDELHTGMLVTIREEQFVITGFSIYPETSKNVFNPSESDVTAGCAGEYRTMVNVHIKEK